MPGIRIDFGRVEAIIALVDLLTAAEGLDDVQVVDAWPGSAAKDEIVHLGDLTGTITQGPYLSGTRTTDDDEFVIPVHISAERTSAQPTSMAARVRCQELMTAVRQTVATAKTLGGVEGVMYVTNAGAEGPDPDLKSDPGGWVAFGTVHVGVRIRMR